MIFINFGKRFRQLRIEYNKTLDDLKIILEVTKATLSRYENSKSTPDANFILKSASYFNVSSDYLLGITDIPRLQQLPPILIKYNQLNDNGQKKTVEYIDDLLQLPRYVRFEKKDA